jgi:putative ABC transport system permease protein
MRRAGWQVSPVIEARWPGRTLTLVGIDPLTLPRQAGEGLPVATADAGDLVRLMGEGALILHPDAARALTGTGLPPVVLSDEVPPGTAIGDISTVQRLLAADDRIDHFLLSPTAAPGTVPLQALMPGLRRVVPDGASDLAGLTDSFHLNLSAFGALSFVVGLFIAPLACRSAPWPDCWWLKSVCWHWCRG